MKSAWLLVLLFLVIPFAVGCELFGLAPIDTGGNGESHLGPNGIPGAPDMDKILPAIGNSRMASSDSYKAVVNMNSLAAVALSYGNNYTGGNSSTEPLVDILLDLDNDGLDRLDLQYQKVEEEE